MGQSILSSAANDEDDFVIRKRKLRTLRRPGHYTGNLPLHQHKQTNASVEALLARPGNNTPRTRAVSVRPLLRPLQTGDSQAASTADSIRHAGFIAAASLVALITGAVTTSQWLAHRSAEPESASIAKDLPLLLSEGTDAQPEDESTLLPRSASITKSTTGTASLTSELQMKSMTDSLLAAQRLSDEYQEEIDMLNDQNVALLQEVDAMQQETVRLNQELLQLDLAISAKTTASETTSTARIAYNIVDVPIGTANPSQYAPNAAGIDHKASVNVPSPAPLIQQGSQGDSEDTDTPPPIRWSFDDPI